MNATVYLSLLYSFLFFNYSSALELPQSSLERLGHEREIQVITGNDKCEDQLSVCGLFNGSIDLPTDQWLAFLEGLGGNIDLVGLLRVIMCMDSQPVARNAGCGHRTDNVVHFVGLGSAIGVAQDNPTGPGIIGRLGTGDGIIGIGFVAYR